MRRFGLHSTLLLAGLLLAGCGQAELTPEEKSVVAGLSLAALPPLPADPTNRVADLPRAAAFGASLFFDTGLSGNGEVACATCHKIDRQFQDDIALGKGIGTMNRRTMPLAGVAWTPWQFWDGRKDSLWSQALGPLENAVEHGSNRTALVRDVARRYRDRYEAIFGPMPDLSNLPASAGPLGSDDDRAAWAAMSDAQRSSVDTVFANLGKAVAAFERSIAFGETRFDRYAAAISAGHAPEGDAAFSDLELEGLRLFIGKANCIECHNGPRFTDDHFHNTGVPPVPGLPEDLGRESGIVELMADPFNCLGPFSDGKPGDCDELRFARKEGPELTRAYKTPSLRGAASRPPYMHAGQFAGLEEVLDHYSRAPAAVSGASEVRGVVFTDRGRKALIAFLKTLDSP
jgi:cytochrome c peroxidase